jgi:type IV pilus biogenesis protein CpaD/CtpE
VPTASPDGRLAFAGSAFDGGCLGSTLPGRIAGATLVLGQASACGSAAVEFDLATRPRGPVTLRLAALASPIEAPEVAVIANDRQVLRGRLDLPASGARGAVALALPEGSLRAGRNRVEVRNLARDAQPALGPWLVIFGAEIDTR